ncbi:MAG: DUF2892 domain-containing protein [Moraxellaceae bacterium]|nr:DUF2892 domain-containing protein [Pseudobdellovibrionaceae bacterium]
MLCNMAQWDRFLRFIISLILLIYAVAGGPMWFYLIGIYLLITSAWGLCPLYAYFRVRTLR